MIANKRTLTVSVALVISLWFGVAPPALGQAPASGVGLAFRALPTPCRAADTRRTAGRMAGNSTRDFRVVGNNPAEFSPQGGTPCGVPVGATAVAVNVTVTGPLTSGHLRAWPYGAGGSPASIINYASEWTVANGLILPICDPAEFNCVRDLTLYAATATHVIVDVTGYFQEPARTFTVTTNARVGWGNLTTTAAPQQSIRLTTESPGQVVVRGFVEYFLSTSDFADTYIQLCYSTASTTCTGATDANHFVGRGLETALAQGQHQMTAVGEAVFQVPAAGTYTFYLVGSRSTFALADIMSTRTTATFNPQ